MAENFYGSICLSDIPRELITTGRNGKKYLNVYINRRKETDPYGNTHYMKAAVPKGLTPPSGANLYIGQLKPNDRDGYGQQTQGAYPPPPTNELGNELPF